MFYFELMSYLSHLEHISDGRQGDMLMDLWDLQKKIQTSVSVHDN